MSAAATDMLAAVRALGGEVKLANPGRLKVVATAPLPQELIEQLRAAKSDLLKAAMIRARLVWHFMRFSTARWVQRRDAQRDFPSKAKPWPVVQGCYAALLSDAALDWLVNGGVITREERGDAASILLSISAWLEQTDR
jgi:hypothetical protein